MRFQRMSDDNIKPRQFRASCPLCGARLGVEHDGIDLGNERVLCPVHGDMGSLEEVRRSIFFKEHRNYVVDSATKIVRTINALAAGLRWGPVDGSQGRRAVERKRQST
jgi:hypothetical protein